MNELIASIKTNQKLWDADESAMLDIYNTLIMQQAEIEALKAKLNADKFCDANCVWTDHHPDCQIGKANEK